MQYRVSQNKLLENVLLWECNVPSRFYSFSDVSIYLSDSCDKMRIWSFTRVRCSLHFTAFRTCFYLLLPVSFPSSPLSICVTAQSALNHYVMHKTTVFRISCW
jgi:hypothetical protein